MDPMGYLFGGNDLETCFGFQDWRFLDFIFPETSSKSAWKDAGPKGKDRLPTTIFDGVC